jgi:uncharacterized membrane protein YhaH (DUF805 family)
MNETMNWYLTVMKKYADFSGRARRKEYWMFALFNMIFLIVIAILDNVLGTTFKMETGYGSQALPYGWLYLIYAFAIIVPGLAVCVRRLHDLGKSGWMLLISFIPLIGGIWLLVLFCTAGNQGENKYGPDPKANEVI